MLTKLPCNLYDYVQTNNLIKKKLQKSNTNKLIILHVNLQRKFDELTFLLKILNADYHAVPNII